MTNYFNSKYPIIALAMNQVSDAKFAIECSNAGIYPSISLFNYNTFNLLLDDIHFFVKEKNVFFRHLDSNGDGAVGAQLLEAFKKAIENPVSLLV